MNEILLLGLIFSLIYTEFTDISPGGLIVPAYFALSFDDIPRMLITMAVAIASVYIIKFLSGYTILYGRRRFALYVVVGVAIKFLLSAYYLGTALMFSNFAVTIGYLVPGILGRDMEKQGIPKTILSLGIVVLLIRIAMILVV